MNFDCKIEEGCTFFDQTNPDLVAQRQKELLNLVAGFRGGSDWTGLKRALKAAGGAIANPVTLAAANYGVASVANAARMSRLQRRLQGLSQQGAPDTAPEDGIEDEEWSHLPDDPTVISLPPPKTPRPKAPATVKPKPTNTVFQGPSPSPSPVGSPGGSPVGSPGPVQTASANRCVFAAALAAVASYAAYTFLKR